MMLNRYEFIQNEMDKIIIVIIIMKMVNINIETRFGILKLEIFCTRIWFEKTRTEHLKYTFINRRKKILVSKPDEKQKFFFNI